MIAPWLQLKRLVGRPTATADHEGQLRYDRDGDADGELYVARYKKGATYKWTRLTAQAPVVATMAQSAADTASTASTVTYADAATLAVTLLEGTWTVYAVGGLAIAHTAGQANWRISIDGNTGTSRTLTVTTEMQMVDNHEVGSIAGGASIDVKIQFKSQDAGTTDARNPWLMVIATRSA